MLKLKEGEVKITAEKAIGEISRLLKTVESIKGAKGLNRPMLTSMRKSLNSLTYI